MNVNQSTRILSRLTFIPTSRLRSSKPRISIQPQTHPNRQNGLPEARVCILSIAYSIQRPIGNISPPNSSDRSMADHVAASISIFFTTQRRCQTRFPRSRRSAPAPLLFFRLPSSSARGAATTTMTLCSARRRIQDGASWSV